MISSTTKKCRDLALPPEAISQIKSSVSTSQTLLDRDSVIIFVCGAEENHKTPTARERFMQYAEKHLTHYQFFMAETFFTDFQNPAKMDLLSIEDKLTGFSDCVLMLLESVGSFTELGAFANSEKIAKIILAVNKEEYKYSKSFVTMGPIAKLDKVSHFKPCIFANFDLILTAVHEITERLTKIERTKRKKIDLHDYACFDNVTPRLRMLFIMDLITIFNPLTHTELIDLLTVIYGKNNFDLHVEIGMLQALGMLIKKGVYYLPAISKSKLFYSFLPCNLTKIRSMVINHFHKYSSQRVTAIREKMGF